MAVHYIINPEAGGGRALRAWSIIRRQLDDARQPFTFAQTVQAAEGIPENTEAIVVIGGDGTVHHTVNQLKKRELPLPLGIIPAGSGNDIARSLGLPSDPLTAWQRIERGRTSRLDLLRIGDRYGVNVVGIGLDAAVADRVNRASWKKPLNRWRLGSVAYVLGLLAVLPRFQPVKATLTLDGHRLECSAVWMMAAANLSYFGGGMQIVPEADGTDEVLDVFAVHNISRSGLLRAFHRVYRGTHTGLSCVLLDRGQALSIETDRPLLVQADGEPCGETPVAIRVEPAALTVFV